MSLSLRWNVYDDLDLDFKHLNRAQPACLKPLLTALLDHNLRNPRLQSTWFLLDVTFHQEVDPRRYKMWMICNNHVRSCSKRCWQKAPWKSLSFVCSQIWMNCFEFDADLCKHCTECSSCNAQGKNQQRLGKTDFLILRLSFEQFSRRPSIVCSCHNCRVRESFGSGKCLLGFVAMKVHVPHVRQVQALALFCSHILIMFSIHHFSHILCLCWGFVRLRWCTLVYCRRFAFWGDSSTIVQIRVSTINYCMAAKV